MSRCRLFASLALVSLIGATLGLGCAGEVGDIDRTQANRIAKADLQNGEWYFGQTVQKNPVTSGFTMQLYGGSLERIRFQIDEKYLLAYRSYAFIPGTEPHQDPGDTKTELLAAYAITSHFDVTREYNPTTGEEGNVISENTSDRQWWERKYMHVDWSQNLAPNLDPKYTWFTWAVFNISAIAPVSYFVQDTPDAEADPDRALFDFPNGKFSFVSRYALHPDIDECLNNVWFQTDCGPATVEIRNVFKHIDGTSTYVPLEFRDVLPLTWDDGRPLQTEFLRSRGGVVACPENTESYDSQNNCSQVQIPIYTRYGALRTSPYGGKPQWNDRRGATWDDRQQRALRLNIWKKSLTGTKCTTDADCIADSQCEPNSKLCTIPYVAREPKPIEWVLSWDYPEKLKGAAAEAVDQWDAVYVKLLQELGHPKAQDHTFHMVTLKDNGCSPTNLDKFLQEHPQLQAVKARVLGGDASGMAGIDLTLDQRSHLCAALEYNTRGWGDGQRFTWERQGELGLNMLPWVQEYQIGMPLGVTMPWFDPVTGEIIHVYSAVFGASLDTYISGATDMVDVLNGKLQLDDVLYGNVSRADVAGQLGSPQPDDIQLGHQQQNLVVQNMALMQQRMNEMVNTPTSPDVLQQLNARFNAMGTKSEDLLRQIPTGGVRGIDKIRGTDLERRLISDEMMKMFNPTWIPGDPVTDEMVDRASPLSWAYGDERQKDIDRIRNAQEHHVELGEFFEDQIIGLAMRYKELNRHDLYEKLYHDVYVAVLLHEMGHALGLDHNFEASMDALNYQDMYWTIRTRLEADAVANDWDAATLQQKENEAQLSEYQYASIMDYGSRFNSDIHGLGKWDQTAINFIYGNLIEVWDDGLQLDLSQDSLRNGKQDYYDLNSAIFLRTADHLVDLMGGDAGNITKRHTMDFDKYVKQYKAQLIASIVPDANGQLAPPVQDRVVPYQYCGNMYAGPPGGYPSCQMWDFGSTMVEKVRETTSYYRNYYYWNNFRRDRFDDYAFVNGFVNRLYNTVYDPLITIFKYFFFYRSIVGQALIDPTEAQGIEFGRDYARAAIEGLNLLGEVLQTPDRGVFCQGTAVTERYAECKNGEFCPERYFEDCQSEGLALAQVPFGVGRIPYFKFSDDLMYKFDVVGSLFEKELAIMALTDTMSVFYGQDFSSNFGLFEINPYRLFQQEMVDLFTGLITSQNKYFAGVFDVTPPADGSAPDFTNAVFKPRLLIDPGKRYPEGFLPEDKTAGKPLVDGMINSTISFYAALYGVAMMSSSFDGAENFSNYTRIVLAGSGDDYLDGYVSSLPEPQRGAALERICTLTDPKTLFTYKGLQTMDGRSVACLEMAEAQKILDGIDVDDDGVKENGWFEVQQTYQERKAAYEAHPTNADAYKLFVDAKAEFERVDIRLNAWLDRISMLREIQSYYEPAH